MFQNDPNGSEEPNVPPEINAMAPNKPPVLPPSLPDSTQRGIGPLAIAAITVTSLTALLAVGLLAVGLFVRARGVEAREAKATQQAPAPVRETRVLRSERPVSPIVREVEVERSSPAPLARLKSEPGLSHTNIKVPSEPWSIHVLKVDRSQKDLMIASTHAGTKVLGVGLLRDQAAAFPREFGRAVAAVNGDFYMRDNPNYAGDPRGLQIVNGELISGPDTVCVWFDPEENPHLDEVRSNFAITWPDGRKTPFALNQQRSGPPTLPPTMPVLFTPTYGLSTKMRAGRELILAKEGDGAWLPLAAGQNYRARVREIATNGNTRLTADVLVVSLPPQLLADAPNLGMPGDVLQISTATTPNLNGAKGAIGGGPALVKDGKSVFTWKTAPPEVSRDWSQRSKYERHPRSAVGWSPTDVYFVTVDGRQPGLSMGMKLAELAEFMISLGCTDAMNLDGGKSAQLWFNGRLLNSAQVGEDTVANSLLVIRKAQAN